MYSGNVETVATVTKKSFLLLFCSLFDGHHLTTDRYTSIWSSCVWKKNGQIYSCGGPGAINTWRPLSVTPNLGSDNHFIIIIIIIIILK
jgi:hypothetical protein